MADPKVRVDASPAAASDARARAASLSKVVGEQRALRKLAVGDVAILLMLGRFFVGLGMGIEGSLHSLFVAELMSR